MIPWNNIKDGLMPTFNAFKDKVNEIGTDVLKYADQVQKVDNMHPKEIESDNLSLNNHDNVSREILSKSLNNLSTTERLDNDKFENTMKTKEILATEDVLEKTGALVNSASYIYNSLLNADQCLTLIETYLKNHNNESDITDASLLTLFKNEHECLNELRMQYSIFSNELYTIERQYYKVYFQTNKMKYLVFSWQKYSQAETAKAARYKQLYDTLIKDKTKIENKYNELANQPKELDLHLQTYIKKNAELENGLKLINEKYLHVQKDFSNLKQSYNMNIEDHSKTIKTLEELKLNIDEKTSIIEQKNAEISEYKAKIAEQKCSADAMTDIKRLQAHLVEVEDTYSQQILDLEDTKRKLESQIQNLSCDLSRNKANLLESRKNYERRLSLLNDLLAKANKDVDTLSSQVVSLSAVSENQSKSVMSLQSSLNDTQRENESQLALINDAHVAKIMEITEKYEAMVTEKVKETERQLNDEHSLSLSELNRTVNSYKNKIEELTEKINIIERSKVEKILPEEANESSKLIENSSNIDNILLRNLILAYLRIDAQHKNYVLKVIAQLVGISEEEITSLTTNSAQQGRLQSTLGWIPGIGGYFSPSKVDSSKESLSELFVTFLEDESQKALSQNPYVPPVSKKDLNEILSRHEVSKAHE